MKLSIYKQVNLFLYYFTISILLFYYVKFNPLKGYFGESISYIIIAFIAFNLGNFFREFEGNMGLKKIKHFKVLKYSSFIIALIITLYI